MQLEQQPTLTDRPTLNLGLIGFSREHEQAVQRVLENHLASSVAWRLDSVAEADAWWVNGARAQLLRDGSLRIGAGNPGARSMRLSLPEVDRPIAFSEPLVNPDFEPAYRFRIDDAASMRTLLSVLQTQWLGSIAARLWLAARLIAADGTLTHRIYHIAHGGRLLVVIDRSGDVGLVPGLTVEELEQASWSSRPTAAGAIPPSFHRVAIPELVWSYALRGRSDLLPKRYLSGPIFFRQPPRIAQRLLRDEHLAVMRALSSAPASFVELRGRTGLESPLLARALAALHLAGSVTSDAPRAGQEILAKRPFVVAPSSNENLWSASVCDEIDERAE